MMMMMDGVVDQSVGQDTSEIVINPIPWCEMNFFDHSLLICRNNSNVIAPHLTSFPPHTPRFPISSGSWTLTRDQTRNE
jgi:hypothetical protein